MQSEKEFGRFASIIHFRAYENISSCVFLYTGNYINSQACNNTELLLWQNLSFDKFVAINV